MPAKLLHIQVDILKLAVEHSAGTKLPPPDDFETAFADLLERGFLADIGGFACITEAGKAALAERLAQDGEHAEP